MTSVPRARRGDPSTSWDAAESVEDFTIRAVHRAQLDLLAVEPGTHEDLWARYGQDRRWRDWPVCSSSGFRTRVRELVDAGLVRDSGLRKRLPSRRLSIVWQLTDAGQEVGA